MSYGDPLMAALFYEEEERIQLFRLAQKGKSICEDDDDIRVFHLFPRKTRTFVPRRRRDLHGGASTSTSLLHSNFPQNPPCFKRLRVMAEPVINQTEKKASRKRRAVQQRKPRGGSKKAKVGPLLPLRGIDPPESILKIMRDMNVTEQEPKLIFEKTSLYETDVKPSQSRLSIPMSQLIRNDFLTPVEAQILRQDINNKNMTGMDAFLVNQQSQRWDVKLKVWGTEKRWSYAVIGGWNDFVAANGLGKGIGISVWTFRWSGLLCFAVVTDLVPSMTSVEH